MEDWLIYTLVFGGILVANIISLVLAVKFTPDMFPKTGWRKVLYYVYFILFGTAYWILMGILKIVNLVRGQN